MSANLLLSLRGVTVRTGARDLVRGLDLDLAGGEVVAVHGSSGSGKTSLLRTISGLQDAGAGTITLGGESADVLGWPAWRRQVMLLFQKPVIFPGNVEANLARPFTYRAVGPASLDTTRARALLDDLRLQDVALTAKASELSVGQQQRLCLARLLLLTPAVLLLDEPTSALDGAAAARVHTAVRAACRDGRAAALVATHGTGDGWWDRALDLEAAS